MTIATVLEKSRKLILEGWCQGDLSRYKYGETQYCSIGAVNDTASMDRSKGEWAGAIYYLSISMGNSITGFNDSPGRTKEEVLAAFDKAIELAKLATVITPHTGKSS